jgi:TetR/AcrR family transcriptional regulator, cholesterol catabolism regulator
MGRAHVQVETRESQASVTSSRKQAKSGDAPLPPRRAPSRRDAKHAELRQRIFEAALDLFRRRGVAATTIRQIALEARVGLGTFFNYFAGKEAVLAEIGRIRQERIEARLRDPARAAASTRERVADILRALVEGMEEEPDLTRAVIRAALTAPEIFHGERARFLALTELLEGVLREGQARGEVAAGCDVEAASHLIISAYIALTLDWAERASDYELTPTLLAHIDTLWRGMAPP